MKAAVFKKRDEMAVIDVPNPVAGAGEVVLKVHNCGICGSDLHAVQYGLGMAADTVMGHEFCGEISSMGDGVNGFQLGDRVTSLAVYRVRRVRMVQARRRDALLEAAQPRTRPASRRLRGIRRVRRGEPAQAARQRQLAGRRAGRAAVGRPPRRQPLDHRAGNGSSRDGRGSNRPLRINLGQGQGRERGGRIGTRGGPDRDCDEARRERGRQPDRERSCRCGQRDHRAPARDCLRMYRRQVDPRRRYRDGGAARPGRRDWRLPGIGQHLSR